LIEIEFRLRQHAAHDDVLKAAAGRDRHHFALQLRDRVDSGRADEVLQRSIDEQHDDSHVDAADRRRDGGADGCGILDVAGEQDLDVQRRRHHHHLRVKPLLLKEAVIPRDKKRHRRDGDGRQADFYVLGPGN
jgi:hypothetical protein